MRNMVKASIPGRIERKSNFVIKYEKFSELIIPMTKNGFMSWG